MGKADDLLRSAGGTISESASHRPPAAAMPAAPPGVPAPNPDRLSGVVRSKAALEVPVDRIIPDPSQPREEFEPEALERLAWSVKTRGVLQPIRVRWDEGRGRYVVIAGERRWRASRMAGLPTIPCVVAEGPMGAGDVLAVQLIENALREDLRPVEQARAYRSLMGLYGWSGSQLAKELGVAQSGVAQALALLDLPATVLSAVDSGALAPSTAYEITKVGDPGWQAEFAARVVSEGLSRSETAAAVRSDRPKGRGGKGPKARKPTGRVLRTPSGPRVTVEWRRGLDDDSVVRALEEALSAARESAAGAGLAA